MTSTPEKIRDLVGELVQQTNRGSFSGADKARSASVRHSPECEAFGTWVLNAQTRMRSIWDVGADRHSIHFGGLNKK